MRHRIMYRVTYISAYISTKRFRLRGFVLDRQVRCGML